MSDIGLFIKDVSGFDLQVENGDLKADDGLETAVAISLFTDRRVSLEEIPDGTTDRRGFWADMFSEIDRDKIGSRLWTLTRSKRIPETLRRAEDFAKDALNWMIEDGVAKNITATAYFTNEATDGTWQLDITITRPTGKNSRFQVVWDAQSVKRI